MGSAATPPPDGWTTASVLQVLRQAARGAGDPLSHGRFQQWARTNRVRVPSILTITKLFGSWSHACAAAGLQPNAARFHEESPSTKVTLADCRRAVRAYIDLCAAEGQKPTADRYKAMSAAKNWPAFGTLRYRLQMPWSEILSTRGGAGHRATETHSTLSA